MTLGTADPSILVKAGHRADHHSRRRSGVKVLDDVRVRRPLRQRSSDGRARDRPTHDIGRQSTECR